MKSDIQTIKKFNAIRYEIISFMAIGFLGGYFLNFLPESRKYLSVFYILIYVAILFLSMVKMYRCPFCSRIPLGRPMPLCRPLRKKLPSMWIFVLTIT